MWEQILKSQNCFLGNWGIESDGVGIMLEMRSKCVIKDANLRFLFLKKLSF